MLEEKFGENLEFMVSTCPYEDIRKAFENARGKDPSYFCCQRYMMWSVAAKERFKKT